MKLRRQPIIAAAAVVVVAGIVLAVVLSQKKDHAEANEPAATPTVQPINLTIMLDLSDRLVATGPNDHLPQTEKDTTIIGHLCQWFIQRQVKHRFMTDDVMRLCFYPTPDMPNIVRLQDSLVADMTYTGGKRLAQVKHNKETLQQMRGVWQRSLQQIYSSTIASRRWVGCDVWGYFNHSAKKQCIRKGYRNVLIIITDGYLYHVKSWQRTATGVYTGISPVTVMQQKAIAPIAQDMSDLEVLFLEINPQKPTHFAPMCTLLTDWCTSMGITHSDVLITDVPRNNFKPIDDFLGQ